MHQLEEKDIGIIHVRASIQTDSSRARTRLFQLDIVYCLSYIVGHSYYDFYRHYGRYGIALGLLKTIMDHSSTSGFAEVPVLNVIKIYSPGC